MIYFAKKHCYVRWNAYGYDFFRNRAEKYSCTVTNIFLYGYGKNGNRMEYAP